MYCIMNYLSRVFKAMHMSTDAINREASHFRNLFARRVRIQL